MAAALTALPPAVLMILEPIAPATLPPSGPKIAPPSAPNAIAVPRPSFHFLPAARLETTWPAPEEIAPITIAATMPAARPPVPITSAVSATATTRLTQKPGSLSSLVTNSNAAFSAFHAAFAALLILPQRPPSSFGGSLDASALTLAWPSETLPWFSPGIFPVPLWTLAAVASSLPLEPDRPDENFDLSLPPVCLTLLPNCVTVLSPLCVAEVAVLLTWVEAEPARFVAPDEAPLAVDAAPDEAVLAWPAMPFLAVFAADPVACVACLAVLPAPTMPLELRLLRPRLTSWMASGASSRMISACLNWAFRRFGL